jgi:hypothetical protein
MTLKGCDETANPHRCKLNGMDETSRRHPGKRVDECHIKQKEAYGPDSSLSIYSSVRNLVALLSCRLRKLYMCSHGCYCAFQ